MTEQLRQEMIKETKLHIVGIGLKLRNNNEAHEHYQAELEAANLDLIELENMEVDH